MLRFHMRAFLLFSLCFLLSCFFLLLEHCAWMKNYDNIYSIIIFAIRIYFSVFFKLHYCRFSSSLKHIFYDNIYIQYYDDEDVEVSFSFFHPLLGRARSCCCCRRFVGSGRDFQFLFANIWLNLWSEKYVPCIHIL